MLTSLNNGSSISHGFYNRVSGQESNKQVRGHPGPSKSARAQIPAGQSQVISVMKWVVTNILRASSSHCQIKLNRARLETYSWAHVIFRWLALDRTCSLLNHYTRPGSRSPSNPQESSKSPTHVWLLTEEASETLGALKSSCPTTTPLLINWTDFNQTALTCFGENQALTSSGSMCEVLWQFLSSAFFFEIHMF